MTDNVCLVPWRLAVALEVAAHAHPRPPVHAHCGFPFPDRLQPLGDLSIVKDPEPAPDVVGRVPRYVREGGQGQRGQTVSRRPVRGVVQQRPAQPAACAAGVDGDLLDLQASIDQVSIR